MKRIASFEVDHTRLLPGMYLSRTDGPVTTYDLRFIRPNTPPFLPSAVMHTIEHLFATYARNSRWGEHIVYFGPMGCRTGFYVIFKGDLCPQDIIGVLRRMADFILNFEGTIPGASPKDCGNYLDLNLSMAKFYTRKYKTEVLDNPTEQRLTYPC